MATLSTRFGEIQHAGPMKIAVRRVSDGRMPGPVKSHPVWATLHAPVHSGPEVAGHARTSPPGA